MLISQDCLSCNTERTFAKMDVMRLIWQQLTKMGLDWPKCSEGFLGLPFSTPVPHVTNVLFMWHVHLGVNSVVADRLPVTWYYLKYWNVSPRAGLITFNEIVLMTRRSLVLALICRPVSNLASCETLAFIWIGVSVLYNTAASVWTLLRWSPDLTPNKGGSAQTRSRPDLT